MEVPLVFYVSCADLLFGACFESCVFCTHKLRFVGWRRFCDGLQIFHRNPVHVVDGRPRVEHDVFDENTQGSEHVGHEEVHVDVVTSAVQSSGYKRKQQPVKSRTGEENCFFLDVCTTLSNLSVQAFSHTDNANCY